MGLVTALVATSFVAPIPVPLLIGLAIPALALDAVDGWVARRTHTESELGARFDMEVDAFLLLVARRLRRAGRRVVGAPHRRAPLPVRRRRLGAALAAGDPPAAVLAQGRHRLRRHRPGGSGIRTLPGWVSFAVTLTAFGMLLESFGRDVLWLVRARPAGAVAAPAGAEPV